MSSLPVAEPQGPSGAVCARHVDSPANGNCERCGAFYCVLDSKRVGERSYCSACAERPEVNYLETFRLKYWGKRDSWAWLMGVGAVWSGLSAVFIVTTSLGVAMINLALAGYGVCYFLGQRWTRPTIFVVPFLPALILAGQKLMAGGATDSFALGKMVGEALVYSALPLLMAAAIYADTRNQLFFMIPIGERRLKKAWHLYSNNTIARTGLLLSLPGLLVPGLSVPAVICSLIGLRRVDPTAYPPIGRKAQAWAGLVLGSLGVLGWATVLITAGWYN